MINNTNVTLVLSVESLYMTNCVCDDRTRYFQTKMWIFSVIFMPKTIKKVRTALLKHKIIKTEPKEKLQHISSLQKRTSVNIYSSVCHYQTYISFPLLPDGIDHVVQLVQLLLWVLGLRVDRDQNQVFHNCNTQRHKHMWTHSDMNLTTGTLSTHL